MIFSSGLLAKYCGHYINFQIEYMWSSSRVINNERIVSQCLMWNVTSQNAGIFNGYSF